MTRRIDISGQRFGKLTVLNFERTERIEKAYGNVSYVSYYKCKCDCGNEKIINKNNLVTGNTKSCGCYVRSWRKERK